MDMDEPAVKAESFKKLKEEKIIPFICIVGKNVSIPWTTGKINNSIQDEIKSDCCLEIPTIEQKLQYFGCNIKAKFIAVSPNTLENQEELIESDSRFKKRRKYKLPNW